MATKYFLGFRELGMGRDDMFSKLSESSESVAYSRCHSPVREAGCRICLHFVTKCGCTLDLPCRELFLVNVAS